MRLLPHDSLGIERSFQTSVIQWWLYHNRYVSTNLQANRIVSGANAQVALDARFVFDEFDGSFINPYSVLDFT